MILESINDKGIFKSVFLIGLPGAGKSYITKHTSGIITPVNITPDKIVESIGKRLNAVVDDHLFTVYEHRIKSATKERVFHAINGMLPTFVETTSNNPSRAYMRKGILQSVGYDVGVIYLRVSLEKAIERAEARAEQIKRAVPKSFIEKMHKDVEENSVEFGRNSSFFLEIDGENPDIQKAFTETQKFFNSPVKSMIGRKHLQDLRKVNGMYLADVMPKRDLIAKAGNWYA